MPEYKLTYFNIRARGEPVRTMLKLAGVEYEEKTFGFGSDEWKKEKSGICFEYVVWKYLLLDFSSYIERDFPHIFVKYRYT